MPTSPTSVQTFRKKPVVIEAVQLTWANWNAICEFVPKPWFVRGVFVDKESGKPTLALRDGEQPGTIYSVGCYLGLLLKTLESNEFLAVENDWIVKGVQGEFYAVKPDIFARTYEPADTTDAVNADSTDDELLTTLAEARQQSVRRILE